MRALTELAESAEAHLLTCGRADPSWETPQAFHNPTMFAIATVLHYHETPLLYIMYD